MRKSQQQLRPHACARACRAQPARQDRGLRARSAGQRRRTSPVSLRPLPGALDALGSSQQPASGRCAAFPLFRIICGSAPKCVNDLHRAVLVTTSNVNRCCAPELTLCRSFSCFGFGAAHRCRSDLREFAGGYCRAPRDTVDSCRADVNFVVIAHYLSPVAASRMAGMGPLNHVTSDVSTPCAELFCVGPNG